MCVSLCATQTCGQQWILYGHESPSSDLNVVCVSLCATQTCGQQWILCGHESPSSNLNVVCVSLYATQTCGQQWILYGHESPSSNHEHRPTRVPTDTELYHYFDLRSNYRLDSDIPFPGIFAVEMKTYQILMKKI